MTDICTQAPIQKLKPGQHPRGQHPHIACPHCNSPVKIVQGATLTRTYRELTYQCKNVSCSCTFKAALEVVEILSPSGTPNPYLKLPTKIKSIPQEPYEGEPISQNREQTKDPPTLDLPF